MGQYTPNPTDVVGTVDTSGINPGPHSTLEGVSPIFEQTRPNGLDETLDETFARQALAAGTEEYQEAHPVEQHVTEWQPFPPMDETPDTTATGGRHPQDTIDRDTGPATSSDQDVETQGTVTTGEGRTTDEADTGEGPLDKRKVVQLKALADKKKVELDPDDKKADIVDKLSAKGVTEND